MKIQCLNSITEIKAAQWDALVLENHPLLNHAFLAAMEQHQCLSEASGWVPRYLSIEENGTLVAAMPLYEKTNSWGEFVFDHAWADAYARYGLDYYPKLVSAIPFSPVFGQKFLVQAGREDELFDVLLKAAFQVSEQLKCSSLHVLFPLKQEQIFLEGSGLLARHDCQYHWQNQAYVSFDDFLMALSAKKRKNIRQERRRVKDAGITFRRLDGNTAGSEDWKTFTHFYGLTYERKWGAPIFNQIFFESVAAELKERMILIMADKDGECIAGALMYCSDRVLYGRHWGCSEYHDALHFEACYYQGIEYCIEHNLEIFEPGAQGPHKMARGFEPVLTHSAHWLADERFVPSVKQFVQDEKAALIEHIAESKKHSAYKSCA